MLPVNSDIPLASQAEGHSCTNMSDQSASFKVTLHRKGSSETEIRRFILPRSALSSYSILRDKLQVVFHSIKNKPFDVTWEDSDGDRVLISSDEELIIAMQEMVGDVHRLRIDTADQEPAEIDGGDSGGPVHSSVWCDVCSEVIKGFRYKCIQCPNFDLCGQCERNLNHKEHFMVRIPEPIVWRPEFGHRLMHQMSRSAKRNRSASHCGEGRGRGNAHQHRPCHSHDNGTDGQRYHFPLLFHQMFQNLWEPSSVKPQQQEEAAAPAASASAEKKDGKQEDGHVTYLKSIGETVAYLLDPLGIDVNIEVETKKDKDAKSKAKEEASDAEKVTKGDEKPAENPKENPTCSTEAEAKANVSVETQHNSTETPKGSEAEADSDQWDVINADALVDSEEVVTENKSSNGAVSKPVHSNSGNSPGKVKSEEEPKPVLGSQYPNLRDELRNQIPVHHPPITPNHQLNPMFQVPYPMVSSHGQHGVLATTHPIAPPMVSTIPVPIPPPISHPGQMAGNIYPHHPPASVFQPVNPPRPHIHRALAHMTSMGFNNEGGWLTSLLEAVNGDVGKALDILSPVKK